MLIHRRWMGMRINRVSKVLMTDDEIGDELMYKDSMSAQPVTSACQPSSHAAVRSCGMSICWQS